MFILVLTHSGCPGQNLESRKMVIHRVRKKMGPIMF